MSKADSYEALIFGPASCCWRTGPCNAKPAKRCGAQHQQTMPQCRHGLADVGCWLQELKHGPILCPLDQQAGGPIWVRLQRRHQQRPAHMMTPACWMLAVLPGQQLLEVVCWHHRPTGLSHTVAGRRPVAPCNNMEVKEYLSPLLPLTTHNLPGYTRLDTPSTIVVLNQQRQQWQQPYDATNPSKRTFAAACTLPRSRPTCCPLPSLAQLINH